MRKWRLRGIRWISQRYCTVCKWITRIKTLVFILIQNPCSPHSSGIIPLAWGYYKIIISPDHFLLLSLTISFFVSNSIQEQEHGILGVAVEIKCSNLRNCITGSSVDYFSILSLSSSYYLSYFTSDYWIFFRGSWTPSVVWRS